MNNYKYNNSCRVRLLTRRFTSTNLEELVDAVAVVAVFLGIAILLFSAVLLYVLIYAAYIAVAVVIIAAIV